MGKFKYPVVIVTWNDAIEHSEAFTEEEIKHEPAVQHTAGFLMKRNKKGITLASEYNDDGTGVRTTNFIPAGMVVKVTKLSAD